MTVSAEDFSYLRTIVKERSGISLADDKAYLIESRLLPIAREKKLEDIPGLVAALRLRTDDQLLTDVVEAMTTNETSFFRDSTPFDVLRDVLLPSVVKRAGGQKLRIWSAACSSGQEPYSIAMTLLENKNLIEGYEAEILATDLDSHMLNKAKEAVYSQFEVQRGLPIKLLMSYFRQEESYGERWLLNDEVKKMVSFQCLNLMESFDALGKFDIIFCRNVLFYFEPATKTQVLDKIAGVLKPHGLVMLGSSETITDLTNKLKDTETRGVYCLV